MFFSILPDFQKFQGLLHNLPTVKKQKPAAKIVSSSLR